MAEELSMDFLKPLFDEELNSLGKVRIATLELDRSFILNEIDPKAYNIAFEDWIGTRNQSMIERANEILDRYDQQDRFRLLTESYRRDAVVPFIGAGLSIPSGYPGWTSFLRQQRERTSVAEADLDSRLSSGDYEGAAQLLHTSLGVAFNEAVESAYGCERELLGVVQYLPYVFDSSVITTNFDDVVKQCYDNANRSFSLFFSGNQAEELPKYLGGGRRVLLKLHGTSTSPKGRILTTDEYNHHYGDSDGVRQALETLSLRTLLFLGCSLSVDRTLQVMSNYAIARGHDNLPRHYAFLEEPPDEAGRLSKLAQLAASNIYPLWYPPGEHDASVEALLAKLAGGKNDH